MATPGELVEPAGAVEGLAQQQQGGPVADRAHGPVDRAQFCRPRVPLLEYALQVHLPILPWLVFGVVSLYGTDYVKQ